MDIQLTTQLFKDGATFVAHAPELDVSSCGGTEVKALDNLNEAIALFLEEADRMGTLDQILEEAGFSKHEDRLEGPHAISTKRISVKLPLVHVKQA